MEYEFCIWRLYIGTHGRHGSQKIVWHPTLQNVCSSKQMGVCQSKKTLNFLGVSLLKVFGQASFFENCWDSESHHVEDASLNCGEGCNFENAKCPLGVLSSVCL